MYKLSTRNIGNELFCIGKLSRQPHKSTKIYLGISVSDIFIRLYIPFYARKIKIGAFEANTISPDGDWKAAARRPEGVEIELSYL